MKPAHTLVTAAVLVVFTAGCARSPERAGQLTPAASSTSILRADRLQRMPGSTAFDALQTMATYMGRTQRQPAPRFILVLDGTRTSNVEMLKGIQASDVFEIRVVGESQSVGNPGEVEIVVTTQASHAPRIG
jgi:hypothetical protein